MTADATAAMTIDHHHQPTLSDCSEMIARPTQHLFGLRVRVCMLVITVARDPNSTLDGSVQ